MLAAWHFSSYRAILKLCLPLHFLLEWLSVNLLFINLQETNRLEYLVPKKTSLRHRLPMGDQGFIDFVAHLLEVNPKKRPSASEALKHPWLSYPYEPISSWNIWRVLYGDNVTYLSWVMFMFQPHWHILAAFHDLF